MKDVIACTSKITQRQTRTCSDTKKQTKKKIGPESRALSVLKKKGLNICLISFMSIDDIVMVTSTNKNWHKEQSLKYLAVHILVRSLQKSRWCHNITSSLEIQEFYWNSFRWRWASFFPLSKCINVPRMSFNDNIMVLCEAYTRFKLQKLFLSQWKIPLDSSISLLNSLMSLLYPYPYLSPRPSPQPTTNNKRRSDALVVNVFKRCKRDKENYQLVVTVG